jgi:hypothetical protein
VINIDQAMEENFHNVGFYRVGVRRNTMFRRSRIYCVYNQQLQKWITIAETDSLAAIA